MEFISLMKQNFRYYHSWFAFLKIVKIRKKNFHRQTVGYPFFTYTEKKRKHLLFSLTFGRTFLVKFLLSHKLCVNAYIRGVLINQSHNDVSHVSMTFYKIFNLIICIFTVTLTV